MKNIKKIVALLMAMVLVVGLLAACGQKTPETTAAPQTEAPKTEAPATEAPTEAAPAIEPCEITHWFWSDSDMHTEIMQGIVKSFNETNEYGIKVKLEIIPWEGGGYSTNLLNTVLGGGGPDTAGFKVTALPAFEENEVLEPLDDYINNWDGKDGIAQVFYDTFRGASTDGKLYLMPWNVQVLYVYYRPSYYKAAGVELPTNYEEFLDAIAKTTGTFEGVNDGQQIYGYGMRGSNGGQEPWGSFIHARGADFEHMNTPEGVQGMQDFIDIYQKGYAPKSAPEDGYQQIMDAYYKGLTNMTIQHIGTSKNVMEKFGDDVSAFPFPKSDKGRWTSLGDTEVVMLKRSEHKDAAFEWMKYLCAGEGETTWCAGTGNVPVALEAQKNEEILSNRFMQISIDGQDFAGILPIVPNTTEWIAPLWPQTVGQALKGEITAEQAMDILQKGLWGE